MSLACPCHRYFVDGCPGCAEVAVRAMAAHAAANPLAAPNQLSNQHLEEIGQLCTDVRTHNRQTVEIPASDLRLLVAELQLRRLEDKRR